MTDGDPSSRPGVFAASVTRRPWPFHAARIGVAVALALLTYVLFQTAPAVDLPIYEVGSVASDNVIAPFAFRVLKTPEELERERASLANGVEPVFAFSPAALDSSRQLLTGFAGTLDQAVGENPANAVAAVQRAGTAWGITLTLNQAAYLANNPRRRALVQAIGRVFDRWLAAGVAAPGVLDSVHGTVVVRRGTEEVRRPIDSVTTFNMLMSRARLLHPDPTSATADSLYTRLIATFFRPTIVFDRATTELRREDVRRSVPLAKYNVLAGEKIIGANEVVGREQNEKLRALHDAANSYRGTERGARRIVGAVLFDFLIVALLGGTLILLRPAIYTNFRWLTTVAGTVALVLIGGAIIATMRPLRSELVPIAIVSVLFSALFDRRVSLVASVLVATLVAGQSDYRGTNALYIALVGGSVAALCVGEIRRRNQSYQWILAIAGAYVVTAVAIGLTLDHPWPDILTSAGFGVVNAVACVALAVALLPMAEAFTGIETDLTLLEWSDLNRPLMQRLSLEAPGTYAHTIAIANLAEAACRAIGANALLARVGAYYHDIGKIAKPQYFVENQAKGGNPHDALHPGTSAQIIRNHVEAGLTLAAEQRLPHALRAFIAEHHGTGSISYFLEKARKSDGLVGDEEEFSYPGPLPQSAETAVVMLADGIEAATRVLAEPTHDKIRGVVDHIVRQRIDQGQLRDAPLTLRQLELVKEEFTRVLSGMYHSRIDYPATAGGVTSQFRNA